MVFNGIQTGVRDSCVLTIWYSVYQQEILVYRDFLSSNFLQITFSYKFFFINTKHFLQFWFIRMHHPRQKWGPGRLRKLWYNKRFPDMRRLSALQLSPKCVPDGKRKCTKWEYYKVSLESSWIMLVALGTYWKLKGYISHIQYTAWQHAQCDQEENIQHQIIVQFNISTSICTWMHKAAKFTVY